MQAATLVVLGARNPICHWVDPEPGMLKTALKMAVCVVDIAAFKAATTYHETRGLPFKARLARVIDLRAKHLNRLAWEEVQAALVDTTRCLPSNNAQLWSDAASGSTAALLQLQQQYSELQIERGALGELIVRGSNERI